MSIDQPTMPTETVAGPDLFGAGHNNPPEPLPYDEAAFLELRQLTSNFVSASDMWTQVQINTEDLAAKLVDQIAGLRKVRNRVEDARTASKAPWIAKGAVVDETFNPLKDLLKTSADTLQKMLQAYQDKMAAEKEAARQEEIRKANAVAEEARRLALDAANSGKIADQVAAEAAEKKAQEVVKAASKPVDTAIRSATGGARTMAARKRKVCTIDKIGQTFLHFRDHPKVAEVLLSLANAEANAAGFPDDGKIPGCTITVTSKLT